jgi:hypothetical protein
MPTDGERMAVLETEVGLIKVDVAEIKADVKTLLLANATGVGVVTFIRTVAPWVAIAVSLTALVINVIS